MRPLIKNQSYVWPGLVTSCSFSAIWNLGKTKTRAWAGVGAGKFGNVFSFGECPLRKSTSDFTASVKRHFGVKPT